MSLTWKCLVFAIIALSFATSPIRAQEFSQLFADGESLYCGLICKTKMDYPRCRSPQCPREQRGTETRDEWTGWHSCGGGHGNPCPAGWTRSGGAKGYDYRSVGFPPRCQEKNKYACVRPRMVEGQCAHPSCGPGTLVLTGATESTRKCHHPVHGIRAGSQNARSPVEELAGSMVQAWKTAGDTPPSELVSVTAVVQAYLDRIWFARDRFDGESNELAKMFSGDVAKVTLGRVAEIIGGDGLDSVRSSMPRITYSCVARRE